MNGDRRSLTAAARMIDARSTRSRQRKVGASEIGVCRRRAGYSHHGHPVSDPDNVTGIAAVLGTWVHKGALSTMNRAWGTIIEQRVETDHLRGHVDGLDLPNPLRLAAGLEENPYAPDVVEVDDLKTKRDGRMVAYVRNRGPARSELYQAHLYASILRRVGVKPIARQEKLAAVGPLDVQTIRLRYFARNGEADDDVQEYPYEQPYDPDIAGEAWEWVEEVTRSTSPDDLPRDQNGPGLSTVCDNCPFVTACWGSRGWPAPQTLLVRTDEDLAATMADYDETRTVIREATEGKDLARAKLDGTEPAIYTDGRDRTFKLNWSGGKMGDPKPDVEAMVALFHEAGLTVPYLDPKPGPRTLHLTRWELPDQECGKPVGDPEGWYVGPEDGSYWINDRPRGGWTQRSRNGDEIETLTAGKFAQRFPDYTEPRPPCVLKKGHSGDCWPDEAIHVLEVGDDPAEPSVAS